MLLDAFTVEETLRFAAKLKTSLRYIQREEKVRDIIERLGLEKCKHTRVGNAIVKGISGGERKRLSIGYELITDPSLLLCDEPTSGLDSSTSLKIMKMLKDEAKYNHLTIICTIHMPSAELFNQFDRLLLLQDGFQVYQGPVVGAIPIYLEKCLNAPIKKFQNPADYVIKLAQAPHTCRADLTFEQLIASYELNLRSKINEGMEMRQNRYKQIDTNF